MLQKTVLINLALVFLASTSLANPCQGKKRADLSLVLAVDISGSVDEEERKLQMQGYRDAFRSKKILENLTTCQCTEVAVVFWGTNAQEVYSFKRINAESDALRLSGFFDDVSKKEEYTTKIYNVGEETYIANTLKFSGDLLLKHDAAGNRLVVNISGDGGIQPDPSTELEAIRTERKNLEDNGITTNGIPIVVNEYADSPERSFNPGRVSPMAQPSLRPTEESKIAEFYEAEVKSPYGFLQKAEGYEDFAKAVQKSLERETCNSMM